MPTYTYIGNNTGITQGGLVSMQPPSNPIINNQTSNTSSTTTTSSSSSSHHHHHHHNNGGGSSNINGTYTLPDGNVVPATEENRAAIASGSTTKQELMSKTGQSSLPSANQSALNFNVASSYKPVESGVNLPLGSALVSVGGNIIKSPYDFATGKVSDIGIGNYWNNIWQPLNLVDAYPKPTNVNPIWKGTQISDPNFVPLGYKDISKMGYSEATINQELSKGASIQFAGLPNDVKALRVSEQLNREYQAKADSGELNYTPANLDKIYSNAITNQTSKTYDLKITGEGSLGNVAKFGAETALLTGVGKLPQVAEAGAFYSDMLFRSTTKPGALFRPGRVEALNKAEVFSDLNLQPFKISGQELMNTEKGAVFKITAERAIPSAKQTVDFTLPVVRNAPKELTALNEFGSPVTIAKEGQFDSFFIKGGAAKTRYYSTVTDDVYESSMKFGGGGRVDIFVDNPNFVSKGIKLGVEGSQGALGQGYIMPEGSSSFRKFNFFGVTKEGEDVYKIAGGTEGKLVFVPKEINVKKGFFSRLVDTKYTPFRFKGKINQFGEITKLKNNGAGYVFSSGGDRGVVSIQKLDLPKPFAAQSIVEQAGKLSLETPKASGFKLGSPGQMQSFQSKAETKGSSIQLPKLKLSTSLDTRQIQKPSIIGKQISILSPQVKESSYNKIGLIQVPTIGQVQTPTEIQTQKMSIPNIPIPKITPIINPINIPGGIFIPPVAFRLPGYEDTTSQLRNLGQRSRKKYIPSFSAFAFGIRGKARNDRTGLGLRPVTKGFEFSFRRIK